jgi:hypothetical protein
MFEIVVVPMQSRWSGLCTIFLATVGSLIDRVSLDFADFGRNLGRTTQRVAGWLVRGDTVAIVNGLSPWRKNLTTYDDTGAYADAMLARPSVVTMKRIVSISIRISTNIVRK